MYDTAFDTPLQMPLRDFIEAQEIPCGDEIRVLLPTCNDDGERIKVDVVYSGKAGDVTEEIGETIINAVNSDFWQNRLGYWHVECPDVYASEAVEAA